MLQKQIQLLLDKPMDRREFLTCIAKGFLLLIGIGGLLKGLSNFTSQKHTNVITHVQQNLSPTHGFGASKFGI